MKRIVLLLVVFGLICLNAIELKSEGNTKELAEKSAKEFGKGNYKGAVDILRENWPLPPAEVDNIIYQTESQIKLVSTRFGNIVGYDFVKTKKIGKSFIKYEYVAKFDNHALRLNYIFYKANYTWKLNSFTWDDKVHLLFD